MRFQSKLAEARTNSKALSSKIVTIQRNSAAISEQKLAKLLVKVNLQNSVGPVHVVMSPENTVRELMKAAIEIYVKEKRRPLLPSSDSRCYELHYSQFSLESLNLDEKLMNLVSRSFFLCRKPNCRLNSSLKNKTKGTEKLPFILAKFMDVLIQIVINLSNIWPKFHPQWI
uniref:DUF7054 domain-containing protein n=1 Tax=Solanum lycopersicum TaxID=4081 RepID=A0A3Q7GTZ8_SOLLC|nr:uncharacterized protein LOC101256008 [Solanum lycopersicum]